MGSVRKRAIYALIAVCLLLFVAPGRVHPAAQAKYTVMVFMNGADLFRFAADNLQEMQRVGSSDQVNVVVETLGTNRWPQLSVPIARDNQRWLITRDGRKLVKDGLGHKPLTDPDTLKEFIIWTTQHYPADKYVLVMWDHGHGPLRGFGMDQLEPGIRELSLAGIQQGIADAVKAVGTRFELIGFDACLLGTVEMAFTVQGLSNFLVASEEIEPKIGWDYTAFLQAIADRPDIGGREMGRVIAESFAAKVKAKEPQSQDLITLSVVDLSRVGAVVDALEALITASGGSDEDMLRLGQARNAAVSFAEGRLGMVDLGDLAAELKASSPAAALLAKLGEAVTYQVVGRGKRTATGLSIFFPSGSQNPTGGWQDDIAMYDSVPFTRVYKDFLRRYAELLARLPAPALASAPVPAARIDGRGGPVRFSGRVDPAEIGLIAASYTVVARPKDGAPGTLLFLAMDSEIDRDEGGDELLDWFTGETLTLNGHPVSLLLTNDEAGVLEYRVPIRLNGAPADLLVLADPVTGWSEVVGAWSGVDLATGLVARDLGPVQEGDRITPLLYAYDIATRRTHLEAGAEFVVDAPLALGYTPLPPGSYGYGFYLVDIAGREALSRLATVQVAAGSDQLVGR